jgi:uncharacterized protein YoxC
MSLESGQAVVVHPWYEEELKSLIQKREKVEADIASLTQKTMTFASSVNYVARTVESQIVAIKQESDELRQRVTEKLRKVMKEHKPSLVEKHFLKELIDGFEDPSLYDTEPFSVLEESTSTTSESNSDEQKESFLPSESQDAPSDDQGKLRSLFLSLSKEYHPDKARDDQERSLFTGHMTRINELYSKGDYGSLLLWSNQQRGDSKVGAFILPTSQELDRQRELLEELSRELSRLKKQYTRLRRAVPNARLVDRVAKGKGGDLASELADELGPLHEAKSILEKLEALVDKVLGAKAPISSIIDYVQDMEHSEEDDDFEVVFEEDINEMLEVMIDRMKMHREFSKQRKSSLKGRGKSSR